MTRSTNFLRGAGGLFALLIVLLVGCQSPAQQQRLGEARAAYEMDDYARAFDLAAPLADGGRSAQAYTAAYLAGLAAQQRGDLTRAIRYLSQAVASPDPQLSADARAALGLAYHQSGRYRDAARELAQAGRQLTGDDRANAYLHAAIAQQKLSLWSQARTHLIIARAATSNPALRQRIDDQLAVTGYTVQLGAFSQRDNARRLATQIAPQAAQLNLGSPQLVNATTPAGSAITLVQVGRFSSYDAAQRAAHQFATRAAIVAPLSSQ